MSIREEQCNKVCRTLDDVLANRPTERDSLIIAVRKAFESLEQLGNSEPLPTAQPERKRGKWIIKDNPGTGWYRITCSECGEDFTSTAPCIGFCPNAKVTWDYYPNCGADMREGMTMKLINIYDAIRAVDKHMLEDGTLDNDISCILEEVTPVMIPQKASSSCSHEKDVQPEPEESFEKCSDCIHDHDSEDICILRRCKHAIAETVECFEPKQHERKRGKWKGYNMDKGGWKRTDGSPVFLICSECGGTVLNNGSAYWNYCPHCGSEMDEWDDERSD